MFVKNKYKIFYKMPKYPSLHIFGCIDIKDTVVSYIILKTRNQLLQKKDIKYLEGLVDSYSGGAFIIHRKHGKKYQCYWVNTPWVITKKKCRAING